MILHIITVTHDPAGSREPPTVVDIQCDSDLPRLLDVITEKHYLTEYDVSQLEEDGYVQWIVEPDLYDDEDVPPTIETITLESEELVAEGVAA